MAKKINVTSEADISTFYNPSDFNNRLGLLELMKAGAVVVGIDESRCCSGLRADEQYWFVSG